MHRINNRALFISALSRENIDTFKERVYAAIRKIHVKRFPYNNFLYPGELKNLIFLINHIISKFML